MSDFETPATGMAERVSFLCRPLLFAWGYLRSRVTETVLVLSGWFLVNLIITVYNKAVFQFADFRYPIITTAVHLFFTLLGVLLCQNLKIVEACPAPGWDATYLKLVIFSCLFTGNIWLSNWSTMVASLPLNQILRASVPLFTVAINRLIYHETVNPKVLPPIAVVIVGCALTVSGDLSTSSLGMILVLVSCAVSSLKGVVTQKAQVNEGLGATDVLRYMCPLALVQLFIGAILAGEVQDLLARPEQMNNPTLWMVLCGAGILAFSVNMLSFRAVVVSDPLSMNVLGNLKQVITSFLAIPLFGNEATMLLIVGVLVACVGSYWYGHESIRYKAALKAQAAEVSVVGEKNVVQLELGNGSGTPPREVLA